MHHMSEDLYAALRRYEAMAGVISSIPRAVERRGEEDRQRYGSKYLAHRDGKFAWDDVKVVRFLVEVCGFTFRESCEAVAEEIRMHSTQEPTNPVSPDVIAYDLYESYQNIFEARSLAGLCRMAAEGELKEFWTAVIRELETSTFTEPESGAEDWDEEAIEANFK